MHPVLEQLGLLRRQEHNPPQLDLLHRNLPLEHHVERLYISLNYLDHFFVVVRLEHRPGQRLHVDVGFSHFHVLVKVPQVPRLHLHASKHRHQSQHCELLVCFVHVVVD